MEILRPTGMYYCIIHYCQLTAEYDQLEGRNSGSVIAGLYRHPTRRLRCNWNFLHHTETLSEKLMLHRESVRLRPNE